jgi:hypothetical protein
VEAQSPFQERHVSEIAWCSLGQFGEEGAGRSVQETAGWHFLKTERGGRDGWKPSFLGGTWQVPLLVEGQAGQRSVP